MSEESSQTLKIVELGLACKTGIDATTAYYHLQKYDAAQPEVSDALRAVLKNPPLELSSLEKISRAAKIASAMCHLGDNEYIGLPQLQKNGLLAIKKEVVDKAVIEMHRGDFTNENAETLTLEPFMQIIEQCEKLKMHRSMIEAAERTADLFEEVEHPHLVEVYTAVAERCSDAMGMYHVEGNSTMSTEQYETMQRLKGASLENARLIIENEDNPRERLRQAVAFTGSAGRIGNKEFRKRIWDMCADALLEADFSNEPEEELGYAIAIATDAENNNYSEILKKVIVGTADALSRVDNNTNRNQYYHAFNSFLAEIPDADPALYEKIEQAKQLRFTPEEKEGVAKLLGTLPKNLTKIPFTGAGCKNLQKDKPKEGDQDGIDQK